MVINKKEKYISVKADEGMVLTSFNAETDDIKNYTFFRSMVAPLNVDLSIYKEITEEENDEFLKLKKEADK
jgi:hypothetical protein